MAAPTDLAPPTSPTPSNASHTDHSSSPRPSGSAVPASDELMAQGQLPYRQIGGVRLIPRSAVDALARGGRRRCVGHLITNSAPTKWGHHPPGSTKSRNSPYSVQHRSRSPGSPSSSPAVSTCSPSTTPPRPIATGSKRTSTTRSRAISGASTRSASGRGGRPKTPTSSAPRSTSAVIAPATSASTAARAASSSSTRMPTANGSALPTPRCRTPRDVHRPHRQGPALLLPATQHDHAGER